MTLASPLTQSLGCRPLMRKNAPELLLLLALLRTCGPTVGIPHFQNIRFGSAVSVLRPCFLHLMEFWPPLFDSPFRWDAAAMKQIFSPVQPFKNEREPHTSSFLFLALSQQFVGRKNLTQHVGHYSKPKKSLLDSILSFFSIAFPTKKKTNADSSPMNEIDTVDG